MEAVALTHCPPVTLFRWSVAAGVIYRHMLTLPGQRPPLLDVMEIRTKKPSRNGVTARFDSSVTTAY